MTPIAPAAGGASADADARLRESGRSGRGVAGHGSERHVGDVGYMRISTTAQTEVNSNGVQEDTGPDRTTSSWSALVVEEQDLLFQCAVTL
jgi:hypothetical protein